MTSSQTMVGPDKEIRGHTVPVIAMDILVIAAVFAAGCLVKFQGWQTWNLKFHDLLPYFDGAFRFLRDGVFLEAGDISSLHSYSPPGTVWLLLPGTALHLDPRINETLGMAMQFLGLLAFLYLFVRDILGRPIAATVTFMVGASRLGFLGIWPIGHPVYLLGMLYFLLQWHRRKSSIALGLALVICSFGLLVDLTILPTLFLIPVIGLIFRPPVEWRKILPFLLLAAALWLPYLRYEQARGFIDIRSMVLQQPVEDGQLIASGPASECPASLPGESGTSSGAYADLGMTDTGPEYLVRNNGGPGGFLRYSTCRILTNLDRNIDANFFLFGYSPLANLAVWSAFFAGLTACLICGIGGFRPQLLQVPSIIRKPAVQAILIIGVPILLWLVLIPFGPLNPAEPPAWVPAAWKGTLWQLSSFIPVIWFAAAAGIWLAQMRREYWKPEMATLAAGLWIPWSLLLVTAQPDHELRFWWIWPAQCIAIAFCAWLAGKTLLPGRSKYLPLLLAGLAVCPSGWWSERLSDWAAHGYAGKDPGQIAAVRYIGERIKNDPAQWSIGYDILTWDYSAWEWSRGNPNFREGAWFDYLLLYEEGIQNHNTSISGLEDSDAMRILETPLPCEEDFAGKPAPWSGFAFEKQFSCFVVYRRR